MHGNNEIADMSIYLGDKISSGGTGSVHEGPDNTVYKITSGDDMANADLLKEYSMLNRIEAVPAIPSQVTIDAGRLGDRCFIQMERIDGIPLDEFLHDSTPTDDEISTIREQIAHIYEELAQAGLYHGDAGGTGNYMITESDEGLHVRIIDFAEGGSDPSGETAREEAKKIDRILSGVITAEQKYDALAF